MYVKRGFFSCCQHNKLIRAFEGSFFLLRSFVPRHCRARQGRLDESKAKGKREKAKAKVKAKDQNSDAQTCGSTCIPQLSLSL